MSPRQALDFLGLGQKSAFLDWKHQFVPNLILAIYGWAIAAREV